MEKCTQPYDAAFFGNQRDGSQRSANEIVPTLIELVKPNHVVDVGCGVGTWLSIFREHGVDDILGIDGSYVDASTLQIPKEAFLSADLRAPFALDRKFDLVVSLEVAEHLPQDCAETFVDSLVSLGPVILFSAAIPFQRGIAHLNLQWPEYWAALFRTRGFEVVDCLRQKFWRNSKVEFWYAQNMLLFVNQETLDRSPALQCERTSTSITQLSLVHPKMLSDLYAYMNVQLDEQRRTRRLISALPPAIKETLLYHGGRLSRSVAARRRSY